MKVFWNLENEFIIITKYTKSKFQHSRALGKSSTMLKYPIY